MPSSTPARAAASVSLTVVRVPSAKIWALAAIGSGAAASGMAISHSSTSSSAAAAAAIASVLRCCRLHPTGQLAKMKVMLVSSAWVPYWQRMSSWKYLFEMAA